MDMNRFGKIILLICFLFLITVVQGSMAGNVTVNKELVILFTHDLHSNFLPHRILTQEGDQVQQGGYAKLAYMIKDQQLFEKNKTLVVDAGDFSMGTLFHTSFMQEASELRLLGKMGYDAGTFGNQDFDFHADGLAKMLQTAKSKSNELPAMIASNIVFSKKDQKDKALRQSFKDYPVKEYIVIERNGIRIGLFGIMGKDAAHDTSNAQPVTFADPVRASKRMVGILKKKEKADLIICLSHSGTSLRKSESEDEYLARKVPEIDIIISGHTHTVLPKPIIVGKTIIVSSGCYGEYLGMMKINYSKGKDVGLVSYDLKNISTGIPDSKIITEEIENYKQIVESDFLAPRRLTFDQVIAHAGFNMETLYSAYLEPRELGLGNMITDAYRAAIQKKEGKDYKYVSLALQPLGLIRDTFLKGKITVADVFQVLSLGLGSDGAAGYPLVSFYVSGKEIKDILEIHTSVAPLKKQDAYLQVSGVKFTYNPYRVPLDRVTSISIQDETGEFQPIDPKKLYRICSNIYTAEMICYISDSTYGLLRVEPKDKKGKKLPNLESAIVYADKNSPKPKQLKEWVALAEYMRSFTDTGKSVPNIPDRYKGPEGRYTAQPSLNPAALIAGGNFITYGALFFGIIILALFVFLIRLIVRKVRLYKKS